MASQLSDPMLQKIQQMAEYQALTRARKKIIWPLASAVILVYFALVLAIAFVPAELGKSISGGATSIGVVLGLGVIVFCLVVTGIYVMYANRILEPLARQLQHKIGGQA